MTDEVAANKITKDTKKLMVAAAQADGARVVTFKYILAQQAGVARPNGRGDYVI